MIDLPGIIERTPQPRNNLWSLGPNPNANRIVLTAEDIEGFTKVFLLPNYDEARPIPAVHRKWWADVTSAHPRVVIAAPRGHAKSTALNHAYGLAASLFKQHPFQIKISRTYALAVEKLRQAKEELLKNERLRAVFRLKDMARDTENDFIAVMEDDYQFRMYALGMEQAVRGFSWGTYRPTLFNGDDMEDDEQVLNPESRRKAMNWVMNTLMPMGASNAVYRFYGTILHQESVLAQLIRSPRWKGSIYEACDGDIAEDSILWPELFPVERLRDLKEMYSGVQNLAGFNREYRNKAKADEVGYFRDSDFHGMNEEDHKKRKTFYVGGDLAFSKKQYRDYTVFSVGGVDEDGILHIVDERRGRWSGNEVIDEMYSINEAWHPDEWFIESGAIKETLGAALELRMRKEGFLNICPDLIPTQDKAVRAMPFQARMRSRGVKWDKDAAWFHEHQSELTDFSQQGTRGAHDDRVDADAWLGQGLRRMQTPISVEEEDEIDLKLARIEARSFTSGMSYTKRVTGYG